ncbi:hypothetical protein F9222_19925 [Escherichia coli]|nr:hypothetical protein F9222_19925 [Escherichia coli]
MTDISNVQNAIRNTINNYRTLAEKTVKNESKTGVVAVLERFFHTLEFLLKNGYRPTTNDVTGTRLPPELRRLQDFLARKDSKDSYILQKDAATRYCFKHSKDSEDSIEVTIEEKQNTQSLYSNYSNYVDTATWKTSSLQSCKTTDLSSILNPDASRPQETQSSNDRQIMSYTDFAKNVTSLPVKQPLSYKVTAQTSTSDLLTQFNVAAQKVNKKPFNYLVWGQNDTVDPENFFESAVRDLARFSTGKLILNGVEIKREILIKIIEAIIPDGNKESTIVNTTPLTDSKRGENAYAQITNNLYSLYDKTNAEKINAILQKPQFPLALLAVVNQLTAMIAQSSGIAQQRVQVIENSASDKFKSIHSDTEFSYRFGKFKENLMRWDIKMAEQNNLYCGVTSYNPYFTTAGEIGISKIYSYFLVPCDFIGNKDLHDKVTIATKLKELIPQIKATVTNL